MKFLFSPMRSDEKLSLSIRGDVLTINKTEHDFSGVKEGKPILMKDAKSRWILSDVVRKSGMIQLTVILPHGANPPKETLYPEPMIVETDGKVKLPAANLPPEQEIDDG